MLVTIPNSMTLWRISANIIRNAEHLIRWVKIAERWGQRWVYAKYRVLRSLGITERLMRHMRNVGPVYVASIGRKVYYQFDRTYVIAPAEYND